jgi:hypothetical protein
MDLGEPNDDWSLYGITQNLKFKVKGIAKVVPVPELATNPPVVSSEPVNVKSEIEPEVEDEQSESSQPIVLEAAEPLGNIESSPQIQSGGRSPRPKSQKSPEPKADNDDSFMPPMDDEAALGKRDIKAIAEIDPTDLAKKDEESVKQIAGEEGQMTSELEQQNQF